MPQHALQDPTHPQHSAWGRKRGEGPREGAERREAARGFGPSPSRIHDCDGSGGRLCLCHQPNDGRGPQLTPGRRCQRVPGKSPAVEGDALVPESLPPSCPPLSSLVLLHPRDPVRTQRPPHGPPKHEGDAGSYHRSGRRTARRRFECAGDTEASNAAAARDFGVTTRLPAGGPAGELPHNRRPTSSPAGFCAGACNPRAGRRREEKRGASGWFDWHFCAQWDHGHFRLYF